ncbi:MAG: adenylate/guanylate cyclase domain-containing protein [Parvibaculum sp.]|nr:adenylate/guanylate cyclase domain-containing protein [Parvibaculum sp.]
MKPIRPSSGNPAVSLAAWLKETPVTHTWDHDRAADHIDKKLKDVKTVEILDYTRDMSLESIPTNKAYKIDAVHLYADILNIDDMLGTTGVEGVRCHRQTLTFLNLHYRAVNRILTRSDARRVDFHNQRLHALVTKPYGEDNEADRVHRAVAIADLIISVLGQTGDQHEQLPNAKVRVGIDSGTALTVNNGRNGGREPLFLGEPANQAAKMSGGGTAKGIFLTNKARAAVGLGEVNEPKKTALTEDEIKTSVQKSKLDVKVETIVQEWRDDLKKNPIGSFEFSRHTPPLRTIDITKLTPGNSRRQEAVSTYADLDGFTAYVARNIVENADDVVRVLHVLRAELDRVLTSDFDGRRVRFIGDCLHGLLCEGTSQTTDEPETVSTAVMCAGALRSSFNLALEKLEENGIDVENLGLQIGFELGPMSITRLGMQGDRVRCSVSRGVLQSEKEQARCGKAETAIGQLAYDTGTDAVRDIFGSKRKVADLDYNEAVEALAEKNDKSARASKAAAFELASPAVARVSEVQARPYAKGTGC